MTITTEIALAGAMIILAVIPGPGAFIVTAKSMAHRLSARHDYCPRHY